MRTIVKRIISIALMAGLILSFAGHGTTALAAEPYTLTDADVTVEGNVLKFYHYAGGGTAPTDIIIPSWLDGQQVRSIGNSIFHSKGLKSVVIPSTVTIIDDFAFYGNQLTSVTIPENVTTIGDQTFCNNQLMSLTIPTNVESIGGFAFHGNQLMSLTIPANVISIGYSSFSSNLLTSVTILGSTSIGDMAFVSNDLTSVTISEGVPSLGAYAFANNQLTSVTIPNSVTSVGDHAFYNNKLTSVTIPAGVTSISANVFEDNQLTSVTILGNVTSIGERAFCNNQLTSITIPNSVVSIGDYAFYKNQLRGVTIPGGITSIQSNTFTLNAITNITIPASVTSISDYALFANQLSQITFESDATSIGSSSLNSQKVNGHFITKWYDNKEYTGSSVDIYGPRSGAVTYYAYYTANVDYQENGGSAVTDVVDQNAHTLLTKPWNPIRSGYRFAAWYLDDGTFVQPWDFDNNTLELDTVLYAKWDIPVSSVTLSEMNTEILLGDEMTLSATVLPENATYPEVTWMSSDESVATVDTDGKVTAVSLGDAFITATADGISAQCNVTVKPIRVTSVTLSSTNTEILLGDEMTLTATVLPENATYPEVTWTSSDESAATVDIDGKIQAVGLGDAVITATADGISAQCNVTVKPIRVTSVTLSSTNAEILLGDEMALTATVLPENATYAEVTWTSSDESIATVDGNGKISAVSLGNTVITATADGISAQCNVTVKPIRVTSVTPSQTKGEIIIGDEATITATVLPEDATYPEVTWASSNENVVTVDSDGKVSAVGVGKAVITATADGKSAAYAVSVTDGKTASADAPKGNIHGRMTDANGNPLVGYTVTLHSDPITAITNSSGEFGFADVPLTSHTLLIEGADGIEIGRYGLSFTQADTASYTKDEKEVDVTCTANTVAIDVLIHVSEDGKTTLVDKVTIIENPKTGGEECQSWVWTIPAGFVLIVCALLIWRKRTCLNQK